MEPSKIMFARLVLCGRLQSLLHVLKLPFEEFIVGAVARLDYEQNLDLFDVVCRPFK